MLNSVITPKGYQISDLFCFGNSIEMPVIHHSEADPTPSSYMEAIGSSPDALCVVDLDACGTEMFSVLEAISQKGNCMALISRKPWQNWSELGYPVIASIKIGHEKIVLDEETLDTLNRCRDKSIEERYDQMIRSYKEVSLVDVKSCL